MTQPVTRLFDSHREAVSAVEALEAAGIHHDRISLIANNAEKWHHGDHDHDNDAHENETMEGAAEGATKGGLIGGGLGLLAGLGMLAIPGLGPVVAAGWLASMATGAVAGAVAGGATGGLLGALKDAGHSDDEAHVYAEGVRRGGSLVSVKPNSADEARQAEAILQAQSGVSAMDRGASYRQAGWTRFDESATPYNADEISAERDRYREQRSFQGGQDALTDVTDGETNRGLGGASGGFGTTPRI
jgi:hypothetical protein